MGSLPSIYETICTDARLMLRQDDSYDLIINYLTGDNRKVTIKRIVSNLSPQIELSYSSCLGTIDFCC